MHNAGSVPLDVAHIGIHMHTLNVTLAFNKQHKYVFMSYITVLLHYCTVKVQSFSFFTMTNFK